jgi:flagellar protein FliO/FliZ
VPIHARGSGSQVGSPAATDGRGQIKRLALILGMVLCVPFLALSQTGGTDDPVADVSSGSEDDPVDESTLLLGESSPARDGQSATVSPFGFWDFFRMVLVLACVVGIIYLIFYLLKRAGNGKYAKSDLIRIVGSQSLPGNRAIYLVQVGAQVFMIGAGGDSVTLLGEITDKDAVDAMILAGAEDESSPRRSFGDVVASLVRGDQGGSLDLMRQQRERLQRLR